MRKSCLVLMLYAVSFLPACAADNPWVGTWKLDPARSHFVGWTFTYSQSADGMYHYSDGPKGTETNFRIDGVEYRTQGASTSTWTAAGDNAWDTIHKTNGILVERVHRQLSPDGSIFDMTIDGTKPDGGTYHDRLVFKRLTAGKGLLGKWISTKVDISVPDTILILPSPSGIYRWQAPAYKMTVEGKLDGSDIPVRGPLVSPGSMVTEKQINPYRIIHTFKIKGRVETVGVRTLTHDGGSFEDVTWIPGKRSETSTGVYVKQ